jgi:hypothetical protein
MWQIGLARVVTDYAIFAYLRCLHPRGYRQQSWQMADADDTQSSDLGRRWTLVHEMPTPLQSIWWEAQPNNWMEILVLNPGEGRD